MNREILKQSGIDYDRGVKRFLGDVDLYEEVLLDFINDTALSEAKKAFEREDYKSLTERIYELKGSSGNTDMTALFQATSALVVLLRSGAYTREQVKAGLDQVEEACKIAADGIKRAQEQR